MDNLKIRQVKLSDKAVLVPQIMVFEEQHALYDEGQITDRTKKRVQEDIARDIKKKKYWVAEINDQIVGWIQTKINDTKPDTLEIQSLFVIEKYRSQGIGTRLISFIEKHFKKKSIFKSRLWVAKQNIKAKKLYKRLGFKYKTSVWQQYIKEIK